MKNLLTPTVPPALCNMPWTPTNPEASTSPLLMHNKRLTAIQIKPSMVHSLLTKEQLQKILLCHDQYTNYSSKRTIYISTASQEKQKSIPEPQSIEEHHNLCRIKKKQERLQSQIDKNVQPLLSKLELGTINYKEYFLLRTYFLNLQSKSLATSKSLFTPGVTICNDTQHRK